MRVSRSRTSGAAEASRASRGRADLTPVARAARTSSAGVDRGGTGRPGDLLRLQHLLGNRAVGRVVGQRLLNDGERDPRRDRCLQLEQRLETALARIPAVIAAAHRGDHPMLDEVRAQLVRVRAVYGVDDAADITARLDTAETAIAAAELHINTHPPQLTQLARVWNTFGGELGDYASDLTAVADNLYLGTTTALQIDTLDRKAQRKVSVTSREMSAIRRRSVQDAMDRVGQYVAAGYVGIGQLNSFYASSYDGAQDDFGAAASLTNNTSSGVFQWLREWEFHIHASVVRAGGAGTPVTGFIIKTGHIKPTSVARDTGTSITVPNGMHAGVIADSGPGVIRWANSTRGEPVLRKQ